MPLFSTSASSPPPSPSSPFAFSLLLFLVAPNSAYCDFSHVNRQQKILPLLPSSTEESEFPLPDRVLGGGRVHGDAGLQFGGGGPVPLASHENSLNLGPPLNLGGGHPQRWDDGPSHLPVVETPGRADKARMDAINRREVDAIEAVEEELDKAAAARRKAEAEAEAHNMGKTAPRAGLKLPPLNVEFSSSPSHLHTPPHHPPLTHSKPLPPTASPLPSSLSLEKKKEALLRESRILSRLKQQREMREALKTPDHTIEPLTKKIKLERPTTIHVPTTTIEKVGNNENKVLTGPSRLLEAVERLESKQGPSKIEIKVAEPKEKHIAPKEHIEKLVKHETPYPHPLSSPSLPPVPIGTAHTSYEVLSTGSPGKLVTDRERRKQLEALIEKAMLKNGHHVRMTLQEAANAGKDKDGGKVLIQPSPDLLPNSRAPFTQAIEQKLKHLIDTSRDINPSVMDRHKQFLLDLIKALHNRSKQAAATAAAAAENNKVEAIIEKKEEAPETSKFKVEPLRDEKSKLLKVLADKMRQDQDRLKAKLNEVLSNVGKDKEKLVDEDEDKDTDTEFFATLTNSAARVLDTNRTRLINWKIVNHGKQTIIIL